jgi:predicted dinucleotide-binding enzyme
MYDLISNPAATDLRAERIARELDATERAKHMNPAVQFAAVCMLAVPLVAIFSLIAVGL